MLSLLYFSGLIILLLSPAQTGDAARQALLIWGRDVVPSLFPYMVLCRLISARLRNAGLRPLPVAAALGLLGGSPSGAVTAASYAEDGTLDSRLLPALCALTGTISPMFFLGTLTTWTGSVSLCRALLFIHLASALLAALIVYRFAPSDQKIQNGQLRAAPTLDDPIVSGIRAILSVGGCIVLFSTAARAASELLPVSYARLSAVLHAVLEIAGGLHALFSVWPSAPLPLTAFLTGFGGFSILIQNLGFLRPSGVTFSHLLCLALLRAILSALLAAVFLLLL